MAAMILVACSSNVPEATDPPVDPTLGGKEDGAGADWTAVSKGVAYQQINDGGAILIAYGGYSAHLSYSAAWATELVDARLGAAGVGRVYAVQGPADPGYDAREIGNTGLRAHLARIDDGRSPIYVVAHSSGSYVAHEMLEQLQAANNTAVLARIAYADLDGGGSGLSTEIVDRLARVAFVYAHDPGAGFSENNATARALADEYAPHATAFEVTVAQTGCHSGAGWCLHDVLVTHRPHNPDHYDLAHDYTDFVNRPVTDEYFDALVAAP
jgi:hypothetical protein